VIKQRTLEELFFQAEFNGETRYLAKKEEPRKLFLKPISLSSVFKDKIVCEDIHGNVSLVESDSTDYIEVEKDEEIQLSFFHFENILNNMLTNLTVVDLNGNRVSVVSKNTAKEIIEDLFTKLKQGQSDG
jgi:hypothetical protein